MTTTTDNVRILEGTTPAGSITVRTRRIDGVEFFRDRRATSFGPAFVGWFPAIPGVAFEATSEQSLLSAAVDWLRSQVATVKQNAARKSRPVSGSRLSLRIGYRTATRDRWLLRDAVGVVASADHPDALRAFAATRLWIVDAS